VSIRVFPGEKLALFGENGAGKTTLLKIIATFLLPDEGKVMLDGIDVIRNAKYARKNISIATGVERSFYYRLSVKENLRFFGMLNGLVGRILKFRVEEVIKRLGLEDYKKIKYMELSKGLKRRLDIARALLKDVKVYIFDEPNAGVDMTTRLKIYEIMDELSREGKMVLIATHDPEDLRQMDRIAMLKNGKKVEEVTAKDAVDSRTVCKLVYLIHQKYDRSDTRSFIPGGGFHNI